MADYTLKSFVADLDAITSTETDPAAITAKAAPLLARLCRNPEAIPVEYRTPPAGQRGRYMLHRAPRFNVTSVIWRPGDEAGSHDHETWGLVGVVENEIQETRYTSSGPRELGGTTALQVREVLRHKPGAVSALVPPHDEIHAMYNPTARNTVEIHVYGKDLAGLQRHVFDKDGHVKSLVSSKYMNCYILSPTGGEGRVRGRSTHVRGSTLTPASPWKGEGARTVKIADVKAYATSFPVPAAARVSLGIGQAVKRDAVVVKVTTDDGLIGWGESHHGRSPGAVAHHANTTLRQLIVGMDAADVVGVWARIYKMQLGSHGMGAATAIAMSGIDMALWDIRGKATGWPLYCPLGGAARPIPAYAGGVSLGYQEPAALVEEARGFVTQGYRALKLRVGDSPSRDLERVAAVRKAFGDDMVILTDANTGYTVADARQAMPGPQ